MTTAVFLHGVGGSQAGWDDALRRAVGTTDVELAASLDTVTLDFDHQVRRAGPIRRRSADHLFGSSEGEQSRADERVGYYRNQQRIRQVALAASGVVAAPRWPRPILIPGELMVRAPVLDMRQAGHYRHDLGLRAAVLDHVSETIRQIDDDILLFAHSLGSVVALDALHLREMRVAMLITFGSPLGVRHFWGQPWEGSDGFPFARVGGWLNVVNTRDPVPWQRGVSNRFPTAVDSFISAGLGYSGTDGFHDATTYVASAPVVATLIDQVRRNTPPDSGT